VPYVFLFATVIPDTRLLDVSIENSIATVGISSRLDTAVGSTFLDAPADGFSYESGDGLVPVHRLSQLVFTVTQFPFVDGVRFELDGRPVQVPAGDDFAMFGGRAGENVDRPVTREDYKFNQGPQDSELDQG
jgi:hypothetical protein